jgi:[glutamine synthetase] adenylyltransferase / [glutamine synthetase]-adenylyl-L-tyrosine phosphorylase
MKRPARAKRPKRQRQETNDGALIRRLGGALPQPTAPAAARATDFLAGLKAVAPDRTLKSSIRAHPPLVDLLGGIVEAAPYLWELVQADPARLVRLLGSNPDTALATLLAETKNAAAAARTQGHVQRILRGMKAEAALLIALADIGGVWPVARVTEVLTDVADTALGAAVHFLFSEAAKRKKLAQPDRKNPEDASGYIVLAMGKMGGRELNFSSDIDLMVFFEAAAAKLAPDVESAAFFVNLTRDLVKLLQERTPDGYVFRVDLRLRPDPS